MVKKGKKNPWVNDAYYTTRTYLVQQFTIDYMCYHCQWKIQDFPLGGCQAIEGHRPPMWALFSKNICENERIGSHWGGGGRALVATPPGSTNDCDAMIF